MKELELFENEKIEKQTGLEIITAEDRQYINARDLHNSLEVGRDFSNWIKDRIEKYGFIE